MPINKHDPRAPAVGQRERQRKEKAEAKALDEAKLRAVNLEQLFGIGPGDRPFWPGSWVHLTVGAIWPMRTVDSVVSQPGLLGDLLASRSSYVIDIPNWADVAEWLEPRVRVEFIVGSSNRVIGVREEKVDGEPTWTFLVTLTREVYDRVHAFAMNVDSEEHIWSSPAATVQIRCDALAPLTSDGVETVNFVGLISSVQLGTAEVEDLTQIMPVA